MNSPKYVTRPIFIVKNRDSHEIHRVYGIEKEANAFAEGLGNIIVVDEWPAEFKQEQAIDTTEAQIKSMASRFLSWRMPMDFNPNFGISFKQHREWPTGTNLFCANQAEQMVRHMLRLDFSTDYFKELASEIRNARSDGQLLNAVMSNKLNIILAALDVAAKEPTDE